MKSIQIRFSRGAYLSPSVYQNSPTPIGRTAVFHPPSIRPVGAGYQLVPGERLCRPAKLAGLETVPVVIQNIPDDRLLEIPLVENIQREDLNPMKRRSRSNA